MRVHPSREDAPGADGAKLCHRVASCIGECVLPANQLHDFIMRAHLSCKDALGAKSAKVCHRIAS